MRAFATVCALIAIFVNLGFGFSKAFQDTICNPNARVTIHVLPHATRSCTKNLPSISSCNDIISTESGCNVDFFVVFYDLTEWKGCEYGVTWEGSSCTYTSCSNLTIGSIVYPGDGIAHAWTDRCHTEPVCIPGFGWITTTVPTRVSIIPHPKMGGPNIGDCGLQGNPNVRAIGPDSCGYAGICEEIGSNPCEVSTEPTTWGQIKALFR